MNVPRVYLPLELTVGAAVRVEGSVHQHLAKVLRLGPGANVVVFNGEGGQFQSRIVAIERRSTVLEPQRFEARELESPLSITLAQAVSRGDRMDHTLQKSVELGVTRVLPLLTRRTAPRHGGARQDKRQRHWQAVISAACEQCGRNRIPSLEPPQTLQTLLAGRRRSAEPWILLQPGADRSLAAVERPKSAVTVIVGAEGGWEAAELEAMLDAGIVAVGLGPRVLRTETAGTVAVAALQLLWGDLSSVNGARP